MAEDSPVAWTSFMEDLVIKTLDPDWIRIRIRIRNHLK
jgi:hypothetical protein